MPAEINLNEVIMARATITIDPQETSEEHTARIARERRESIFEMVKSYVLFFAVIFAVFSIGGLFTYEAVFDPSAPSDTKRWAQTALAALFTGCVSFVLGQMTAKRTK
jgi:hypothetical protein